MPSKKSVELHHAKTNIGLGERSFNHHVISKECFVIIMGWSFQSLQSMQSLTLIKGTHIFNMHCTRYSTVLQRSRAVISMIPYGNY